MKIRNFAIAMMMILALASSAFAADVTPLGAWGGDVVKHLKEQQDNSLNMCFNSGALAAATDDVTIAAAVNYVKDGVFGQIGAGEITMAGDTQAVSTTKIYLFSYNTTASTTEITIGASNDTVIENIIYPTGNIPFGYVKVVTSSTQEYVPGTTTWATSGVTETFYNIAIMPYKIKVKEK